MAGAQELARKAYINRSIEQVMASGTAIDRERERVREIGDDLSGWRRWGPYVSDRSWGTVREDYSHDGNAWGYLTHDMARAKAYRWGEDGIAGLCDRYQLLCFAPAFWNGRDPILKERLFGLTPYEGNHGEDVKEYYFHLDNTPTHSYMCLLYKYPQAAFPYRELIEENQRRAGQGPEYELLDTGVFDDDRYFDIFVEYAKADPEDLAIRIEAHNRGPDAAPLHILPTSGSATPGPGVRRRSPSRRSRASRADGCMPGDRRQRHVRRSQHAGSLPARAALPVRTGGAGPVHRQRDQRRARLRTRQHQPQAVHQGRLPPRDLRARADGGPPRRLRHQGGAALPSRGAGGRLGRAAPAAHRQADPPDPLADGRRDHRRAQGRGRRVLRRASPARGHRRRAARPAPGAGRAALDASRSTSSTSHVWLDGDDPAQPPPASRQHDPQQPLAAPQLDARDVDARQVGVPVVRRLGPRVPLRRRSRWSTRSSPRISSGCCCSSSSSTPTARSRPTSGSSPTSTRRSTPGRSGASTTWTGSAPATADREFLERCFHKLLINFAWWVNKVDREGNNVFEGGFLGLDNITVVDRSEPLRRTARCSSSPTPPAGWGCSA